MENNMEEIKIDENAFEIISKTLNVKREEITNIEFMKLGMTNTSFTFTCNNKKYIMRIPGKGINREEEASVYKVIANKGICDDIIYINSQNGYKITEFIENARVCDPSNDEDLKKCMKKLKQFHDMKFKVNHEFDIWKKIEKYQELHGGKSVYDDYEETKKNVLSLKPYIDENIKEIILSHIDPVADNFLITPDGKVRLIDWEYAGMQDPDVDIAMFAIYSMLDREKIDNIINYYFDDKCDIKTRIKIYCYISVCGLLWSNWCEYEGFLEEYKEYSLAQYNYAKEYYDIVKEELLKLEGK